VPWSFVRAGDCCGSRSRRPVPGYLSPSHLLDAVEKLLDGTGTSESEPEERHVVGG